MTWLLVDVQLIILVVVHETPPGLVHGQMKRICLVQQVGVFTVSDRSLDLNHLASNLLPDGVDVGVLALTASFSQPALHGSGGCLQVVMSDLEISEFGKCRIFWQWTVDGKFDFLGIDIETVSNIDTYLESHTRDQSVNLGLKVRIVVDDVNIGVTNPCFSSQSVPLSGLGRSL